MNDAAVEPDPEVNVAYDPVRPVDIARRGVLVTVTASSNVTVMVTRSPVRSVPEDGTAVTPVTFAGIRTNASEVVRTYVPITEVEIANCPSEADTSVEVTVDIGV